MFSQNLINKNNVKIVALFAAALVMSLGLATIAPPQADAAGCKSKIAAGGQIKGKSGKYYYSVKAKACGSGLAENTVSFCDLDSRTNPRVHGPCYGSGSVKYIKNDYYRLKSTIGKNRKPSSQKMVVITDDGQKILYKIVNFR